jgi:site-specific DNA-cytosine methylase
MGDGLNFEDPRSRLFWEYVRLLKEIRVHNPNVKFLLENVKMKKEWRDIISAALGVEPILINSALVSAQNRERYYWTNIVPIDQIQQPEDRGIFMDDILIDGIAVLNDTRGENPRGVHEVKKANCICAHYGKGPDNHGQRTFVLKEYTPHEKIKSGKCIEVGHADIPGYDIRKRVYSTKGKSPAATAHTGGHHHIKIAMDKSHWRKLLPLECERLQTLPDNYTEGISDTQRYRCVGNGWNIDTIVHLLKYYRP